MAALDGMRILDMTQYEAGTSCTQALAWLGADVVKIEPPTGDPGRQAQNPPGNAPYFIQWNSNKRSISLDLANPRGRDLLLQMAPHYDVFVENYAYGVMEKLDIGYEVMREANPGLIYARLKGFGLSGPYAPYRAFDTVAQAMGGGVTMTGTADGPPLIPGTMTGDTGTGLQLALAISAAYIQRTRTGEGQFIEISMQEALTYFMRTAISAAGWDGSRRPRHGSAVRDSATMRIYPCKPFGKNDHVVMLCVTQQMWDKLCLAIGKPHLAADPRFNTDDQRLINAEALTEEISAWTSERTKYEVFETLGEAGVPCGAVQDTAELFEDRHMQGRGFIHELDHPEHGPIRVLGWAPRLSASEVPVVRAPLHGEHSADVLREDLGLDESTITELFDSDVLVTSDPPAGPGSRQYTGSGRPR
tara:strand:- start:1347 stop:2597 length:1251 start_codon:yes stop_codon:yes gene_type:complete